MGADELQDPREAARDRRARRFAGATAMLNTLTALTGIVLGPCVLLLMWPYVLAGSGLLVSFVLLITVGALGQLVTAEEIWRRLQGDRTELSRSLLHSAVFSGVIGLPALCWTFYLAQFMAAGSNFWGYEWVAVAGTSVLCIPAVSGLAGVIAWWRYRLVYAAMPSVAPPVAPRRRRVLTTLLGSAVLSVTAGSWLWSGGPPPAEPLMVRGRSLDAWLVELQLGEQDAQGALAEAGRPAIEAVTDRLTGDGGFRWSVADWMGNLLNLGSSVAKPLKGVRVQRMRPQLLRQVASSVPDGEQWWVAEVVAMRLPDITDPAAREAAVWVMSYSRTAALPWLFNVMDTEPDLRATAVNALIWALPRHGEKGELTPDVLDDLDRRVSDPTLDDLARLDLAGTMVRLAPPGERRDRWLAWFSEQLQVRAAGNDSQALGRLMRGLARCGAAAAPLADQLAALPNLAARLTIALPVTGTTLGTATTSVQGVWTLRAIAPSHRAITPAVRTVLTGTDHMAHATALYTLRQPESRAMALQLRAPIVAVCGDGGPACFQQGLETLSVIDGDITAGLPALKKRWGVAGLNTLSLIFALRALGARAAPALPFLRSQVGLTTVVDEELQRLIGDIGAAVRAEAAAAGPGGRGK